MEIHTATRTSFWEAAVKSTKTHLRKILGEVKLTYEEMSTVLSQIEACLNSRPLVPLNNEDDGIEALTPGHFLIGRPLKALPDASLIVTQRWPYWNDGTYANHCYAISGRDGPGSI